MRITSAFFSSTDFPKFHISPQFPKTTPLRHTINKGVKNKDGKKPRLWEGRRIGGKFFCAGIFWISQKIFQPHSYPADEAGPRDTVVDRIPPIFC